MKAGRDAVLDVDAARPPARRPHGLPGDRPGGGFVHQPEPVAAGADRLPRPGPAAGVACPGPTG